MQLLSNEIAQIIGALFTGKPERSAFVCKLFDPTGSWTWYAWEGSPVDEHGYYDTDKEKVDFLFFGLVIGFETEFSYLSLNELANAKHGLREIQAFAD